MSRLSLRDRVDANLLAGRIAIRASVTDITSFGRDLPNGWYDVSHPRGFEDEAKDLKEAIEYLSLLGLLRSRRDGAVKIRASVTSFGGKR
jgi:hypothetical protein